ncbi:hypothetical protein LCGC14_0985730 [marine sediment metagenome]|uniref:Uncharacterized protein n=1 Tax=marine sediment metagenome TaxID=412755 RepID=A0A0F9RDX2_9ZZZZ
MKLSDIFEYFGQMSGVNQVSSYVGTETSGKSLTPREKRQLAKSKQKKCGDTCPCWNCRRTTPDERIDRIKSHYNEAVSNVLPDKYGYALGVWLEPKEGYAVEELDVVVDMLIDLIGVADRVTDPQGTQMTMRGQLFFTVYSNATEELNNVLKKLRRLGRGKPKFTIKHHTIMRTSKPL